jgi:tRNA threonylcarbamoyladenosine biosynthesis protein TsaB
MKLLALDTSTECCSVALLAGDVLTLRDTLTERDHAELVLRFVDELLGEAGLEPAELDGLAFGRGPGAFTGLRIAAGVVQGLAYAAGLRVVPVSSLAAVAARVPAAAGETVLVCNDARMGELYWGHYVLGEKGSVSMCGIERVGPPDAVGVLPETRHVAGNGLARHPAFRAALADRGLCLHEGLYPRADAVARLGAAGFAAGHSVAPHDALPVYVRDEVATARAGPVTPLQ